MILSILVSLFTSLVTPVDTSIHTTVEAQAIVSDAGATPFWMRSLQYGSVPMENPGLVLRAWNGKGYNLKKKYDWKYEVEATAWTGKQNDFWLTQAYVSGRRGKWELWAGRRKEVYGLGDTTMTGGFYAWSGNAVPMPKIHLGTRDYLNFAKGWLGIHMTYSHGWFDNQGPVIDAYLHQKTLYGRIGKSTSKINLFGGINHNVSWGGEAKVKVGNGNWFDYYPSNLNTYFYVITLLKDRSILPTDPNSSGDDLAYQFGNHLGSVDIAFKFQSKILDVLIYRQSIYETGRIAALTQINDGLSGLSFKLKKTSIIDNLGFEYLYTANQGSYTSGISQFLGLKDPHAGEIESYQNNGGRGPWKYWNKTLGTPLFILDRESKNGGGNYFSLNAIKSFHMYLAGHLPFNLLWKARFSNSYYAMPKGNYQKRLEKSDFVLQNSFHFSIEKLLLTKYYSKIQFGMDNGSRFNNSIGMSLSINYKLN
jgi:hypothetical protein